MEMYDKLQIVATGPKAVHAACMPPSPPPPPPLMSMSNISAYLSFSACSPAWQLLAEADEKLFIIGTGPRAVQADPVELAMVDQADWPALFPQPLSDRIGTRTDLAEASGRGLMEGAGTDLAGRPNPDSSQARPRRLRLVDASKGGPEAAEAMGLTSRMGTGRDVAEGSGRDPNGMERESDELGRNLAELREQIEDPEKQKQLHRLAVAHAMQLRILEEVSEAALEGSGCPPCICSPRPGLLLGPAVLSLQEQAAVCLTRSEDTALEGFAAFSQPAYPFSGSRHVVIPGKGST